MNNHPRYNEWHDDVTAQEHGTPFSAWLAAAYPSEYLAPTAKDAGTIDTPDFRALADKWQLCLTTEIAAAYDALVAHIDKHVAAAKDFLLKELAAMRIAHAGQLARAVRAEADLAKLRSTAGVGELIEAARKETRDYYEAKIADLFAATAPVSQQCNGAGPCKKGFPATACESCQPAAPVSGAGQVRGDASSAERTLRQLGYTDHGGEFWKPPLGVYKPQGDEVLRAIETCARVVEAACPSDRRLDTAAKIRWLATEYQRKGSLT